MNEIVSKPLMPGDGFMPKVHLRQTKMYSACEPFTKNEKKIQKFKEAGDSKYIYQNKLIDPCFLHGMAYKILKKQLLIKNFLIRHLILLKMQNVIDIKEPLF